MWYKENVVYQIFPYGFTNSLYKNDGILHHRLEKVKNWSEHIKNLGCDTIYFSPIFKSEFHGYDTIDYRSIDNRLGTNQDFKELVSYLHDKDIKVVIDGVFNHVGREFWAFQDVLKNREQSIYKHWFYIDFNNKYNGEFYYENWEGHNELVKLNLKNQDVVNYLLDSVKFWIDEFNIDGIRLDVAYLLDENFLRQLNKFVKSSKNDFYLVGEFLHGDFNRIMNNEMLDSLTNYQLYKGIWSSLNDLNLFELWHSLEEQFTRRYVGSSLWNFLDNHDVNRISSILKNPDHLKLAYGILFSIPGVPCVYYGSEWGVKGERSKFSDKELRPYFENYIENDLYQFISKLAKIHKDEKALLYGNISKKLLTNKQLIFERSYKDEKIMIAINIDNKEYVAHFNAEAGRAMDLITNKSHDFGGGSRLKPNSISYWKVF
ncbi:MAG: maltodextrin glucosidase [Erysipelotrichaceae bacterium]|nr:maltodextrin glucosidase [Erysipelotrichaceae bacterium]